MDIDAVTQQGQLVGGRRGGLGHVIGNVKLEPGGIADLIDGDPGVETASSQIAGLIEIEHTHR